MTFEEKLEAAHLFVVYKKKWKSVIIHQSNQTQMNRGGNGCVVKGGQWIVLSMHLSATTYCKWDMSYNPHIQRFPIFYLFFHSKDSLFWLNFST